MRSNQFYANTRDKPNKSRTNKVHEECNWGSNRSKCCQALRAQRAELPTLPSVDRLRTQKHYSMQSVTGSLARETSETSNTNRWTRIRITPSDDLRPTVLSHARLSACAHKHNASGFAFTLPLDLRWMNLYGYVMLGNSESHDLRHRGLLLEKYASETVCMLRVPRARRLHDKLDERHKSSTRRAHV